ncbi:WG repeat-containing protein [Moheibacter stercoris]|uniref:WG containing repeat-containing protein n=1 Tax=Moheibacter stercoris TaxID=1628251 RepID=A0ABV2LXA0_9FLAO
MKPFFAFFILLVSSLLLHSCGTYQFNRTKEFSKFEHSFSEIDGEYYGYSIPTKKQENPYNATLLFNLGIESDFFTIKYLGDNKVKIEYTDLTNEGYIQKELILEGKLKKRFFEVYFNKKQLIIPVLFSTIQIDRIRIGKDENGNLVLMNFYERSGNLFILSDSKTWETPYIFIKSNQYLQPRPYFSNGKWGYKDSQENIVIEPKYEFTKTFYDQTAIVKNNGKLGLVNFEGLEVSEPTYDELTLTFTNENAAYYLAKTNDKIGIINTSGEITVPVIYDEFRYGFNNSFSTVLNDKYGYANIDGVIIPAIYAEKFYFNHETGFAKVERDGYYYFVDKEGYEYEAKTEKKFEVFSFIPTPVLVPDLTKKRKIKFEEQFIE